MVESILLAVCLAVACTCAFLAGTRDSRLRTLRSSVESLESDRTSVKLELEAIAAHAQELLDRTESKRRRFAASEARERAQGGELEPMAPPDRSTQLRIVRERLAARRL